MSDRIDELDKRINDLAADKINLRSKNMELEAKLAKAVEGLAWCSIYEESEVATTTLAELKGAKQ